MDENYLCNKQAGLLVNSIDQKISESEISKEKHILRVAAYCRISSYIDQQMDSLEIQMKHFKMLIHNNPAWDLVGIYIDDGITGTDRTKRMGFQRMIRHCEEGKIDRILVKSVSRFGRNTAEVLDAVYALKEKHIGVFFEKENIDTLTLENDFVLSTIAAIAQDESRSISENITWSLKTQFQQGEPIFYKILGYNIEKIGRERKITINEEEAEIVKEIFELASNGVEKKQIALMMTRKGYKTARGEGEWIYSSIKSILTNEKYTGDVLCQKMYIPDYLSHKHITNEGELRKYLIENNHPAIICHELFEKVQTLSNSNKSNKNPKRKKNKRYLFTERLLCGECGANYQLSSASIDPMWRCGRKNKDSELCNSKPIYESTLEEVMRKALEIRYGTNSSILNRMKIEILRVHENDNFENQRLIMNNKFTAAMEIVRNTYGDERENAKIEQQNIEEKIIKTEKYWKCIEEDRVYRIDALKFINELPRSKRNSDEILQELKIEFMRAIIMSVIVSAKGNYLFRLIDGDEIEIYKDDTKKGSDIKFLERKTTSRRIKSSSGSLINIDLQAPFQNEKPLGASNIMPFSWSFPALQNDSIESDETHKKRICAYCRVSSKHNKQLSSFKLQITHYTDLILSNEDWTFGGIYADEGVSGTSIKGRKNFLRMIEDCKKSKIDMVIVKSLSRFARNTIDCLSYIQMLKNLPSPVGVYFERENINSLDDKNNLLIAILGGIAQAESLSLSNGVKWGYERRFENGIVNMSIKNLFGYNKNAIGSWIIDEEEAKIVRRIYREYLEGKSYNKIAKGLTEDDIKTCKGLTKWRSCVVSNMLLNEKYCGDVLLQKSINNNFMDQKRIPNIGQKDKYLVVDHHEAIVSKEEWNTVQIERTRRNESKYKRDDRVYSKGLNSVISGKIFCSNCGNQFFSKKIISQGTKHHEYWIWRCRAYAGVVPDVKCNVGSFRDEEIKNAFMAMILELKNKKDELVNSVHNSIRKMVLTESEVARIEELNKEIKSLYNRLTNSFRFADKNIKAEVTKDCLIQFLQENEILQNELDDLNKRVEEKLHIINDLNWLLKELNTLKETDPMVSCMEFSEDIFSRIVKRCVAYKDGSLTFELSVGISWHIEVENIKNWIRNNNDIRCRYRKKVNHK